MQMWRDIESVFMDDEHLPVESSAVTSYSTGLPCYVSAAVAVATVAAAAVTSPSSAMNNSPNSQTVIPTGQLHSSTSPSPSCSSPSSSSSSSIHPSAHANQSTHLSHLTSISSSSFSPTGGFSSDSPLKSYTHSGKLNSACLHVLSLSLSVVLSLSLSFSSCSSYNCFYLSSIHLASFLFYEQSFYPMHLSHVKLSASIPSHL